MVANEGLKYPPQPGVSSPLAIPQCLAINLRRVKRWRVISQPILAGALSSAGSAGPFNLWETIVRRSWEELGGGLCDVGSNRRCEAGVTGLSVASWADETRFCVGGRGPRHALRGRAFRRVSGGNAR